MSREIKSRAWIVPLNKWADEICMEFTSYGIPPLVTACMQGRPHYTGDKIIIEWFTGLTDKNGVGVYEGDLYNHITSGYSGVIKFGDGCFYCDHVYLSRYSLLNINNGEVIGNIHENPELLEVAS